MYKKLLVNSSRAKELHVINSLQMHLSPGMNGSNKERLWNLLASK